MTITQLPTWFDFEDSYARALPELSVAWQAGPAPQPRLLALNAALATELGLDPAALRSPEGVGRLLGASTGSDGGVVPVAQAYSGHQFGGFSPRLGDGRALLLGEVVDPGGRRRDVHLKGSGRTPFARGGDGKAVVGPMLREYVVGEAMHGLGIPTTRALAVVATGETVRREQPLPGAVLVRVAASHLRVGTFQYAANLDDPAVVGRLLDYAVARHHPAAADAAVPALAFFDAVVGAQADLVARWMLVGFIHGVMNTDNMTISGETIDFGPCAFMDAFDPATVFSSIDEGGRYAYGNQPRIAAWNLARLGETLLPLIDTDADAAVERATEVLQTFGDRFEVAWRAGMHAKLGLGGAPTDAELVDDLLELLRVHRVDWTTFFRALAEAARGDDGAVRAMFDPPEAFAAWSARWRAELARSGVDLVVAADAMDTVNPLYVPRNHRVEEALAAATAGDLGPVERLIAAVSDPFRARPGLEDFVGPAPASFGPYRTFCGT